MLTNLFHRQPKQSATRGSTGEICHKSGTYIAGHCPRRWARDLTSGDRFPHCRHGKPTAWQLAEDSIAIKVTTWFAIVTISTLAFLILADHVDLLHVHNSVFADKIIQQRNAILALLVGQSTILLIIVNLPQWAKPTTGFAIVTLTITTFIAGFIQMDNRTGIDALVALLVMVPLLARLLVGMFQRK